MAPSARLGCITVTSNTVSFVTRCTKVFLDALNNATASASRGKGACQRHPLLRHAGDSQKFTGHS